jgi:formylglycine-generating enzyme required for sulfatase activity
MPRPAPIFGKAGIEWVSIPGGSFMMGNDAAPEYGSNAKPAHRVTIRSFQMAKTLVTNKQYRACVAAGACTAPAASQNCLEHPQDPALDGDDQPVVCVSWEQARTFSQWAGGRLPSEAEWEYAARSAGQERKYPWGDEDPTCERTVMSDGGNGCGRRATWPVCSKPKGNTDQGLCDMSGNVYEWVQDWYHNSYVGAPNDGSAWENPAGSSRAMRGGAWLPHVVPWYLGTTARSYFGPSLRVGVFIIGLRPVR